MTVRGKLRKDEEGLCEINRGENWSHLGFHSMISTDQDTLIYLGGILEGRDKISLCGAQDGTEDLPTSFSQRVGNDSLVPPQWALTHLSLNCGCKHRVGQTLQHCYFPPSVTEKK